MKFSEYSLKKELISALNAIEFYSPTPIQELVIPRALKGENVIVQSATGSGKTHAFLIPILEKIDLNINETQAVILSPTRELANQLYDVTLKLVENFNKNIAVTLAIGGSDRENEIKKLTNKLSHIVIGTVGRLNDLVIDTNILKIHNAKIVVIDEADMVFDQKELEEVDKLIGKIQDNPQFLVFSATIPVGLRNFLRKYLENLEPITIEETNLTNKNIKHIMVTCKAKNKKLVLKMLLEIINPYLSLIFCNTKETVEEIAMYLAEEGFKVGKIHGDLDDRIRKQTLKRIANLEYKYVVASDIASRGIDIQGVSHIINYDLPNDIEFYIHRTGRTGRFDQTGIAYSLYSYDDDAYVKKLLEKKLVVEYQKIENNTLVETKKPTKKITKKQSYEEELHSKIRMPKKVKPGYKKKRKEEINRLVKKAKHAHIDELYHKRGHKNENR